MSVVLDALGLATDAQRRATTPGHSAWVEANAGTGKTKVLTDRVTRLLLDGVKPERILCLTFTKAAAAEMRNRYGRNSWGQSTLLARRLVEAGARVVTLAFSKALAQRPRRETGADRVFERGSREENASKQ